jgi:integrase
MVTKLIDEDTLKVKFKGGPANPGSWTRNYYKPILLNHGLTITFHDLRHIYAHFLREQGMPIDFIQKQFRHASYSTPADIYSEVPKKQLKRELDNIDDFIFHFRAKYPAINGIENDNF